MDKWSGDSDDNDFVCVDFENFGEYQDPAQSGLPADGSLYHYHDPHASAQTWRHTPYQAHLAAEKEHLKRPYDQGSWMSAPIYHPP